ncbi:MAG: NADH:ubiquinone oxidoreductase [Deltaproteobacteria bacterium]|nr:NADH:ubiquinone oxidoreductase [Deltaproteobacteria bacterium]
MTKSLYWIHCGGCGGDTISFLNAESPDMIELFDIMNIELLWHPSLSDGTHLYHQALVDRIVSGEQSLDILCVEGAVIRGPSGTGMYDTFQGKPKKDLVANLAKRAQFVIAVGTCASFGGVGGVGEVEGTGLQFFKRQKGGFLGQDFHAAGGLPVINLPGCPCHPDVLAAVIMAIGSEKSIPLTKNNSPVEWYGMLVHQGCTRNEYHEYRVEEEGFGERGCLFFHLGCHGPLAYGPCNKTLWNKRNSKTRVGVPCFGCTQPDFPQPYPFFETRNIEGIPLELPDGIDRAHYMAYKGLAAAAAPQRLKQRKTVV